jgi:F-type H+-transporting ATPase subunit a
MPEHELWITALLNDHLAGLANWILGLFNLPSTHPVRPWENWIAMELLVVAIVIVLFAFVRATLSVDNPGKLQHMLEAVWEFVKTSAEDVSLHHANRYIAFFGTIFIYILLMNLIGIIPGFESPTQTPAVPAGLALCTLVYYNVMGVREHGIFKYLAHFAGPVWWLAFLMIPIEIISHLARPLSLTFRLYGNMFAGEQVTGVFMNLTYLVVPAVFMALHVFVAFMQAYIFMLLAMIYVSLATAHDH